MTQQPPAAAADGEEQGDLKYTPRFSADPDPDPEADVDPSPPAGLGEPAEDPDPLPGQA
jgi:hypothetical protein